MRLPCQLQWDKSHLIEKQISPYKVTGSTHYIFYYLTTCILFLYY